MIGKFNWILSGMLLAAFMIIGARAVHMNAYRQKSSTCIMLVDLDDQSGYEQIEAIRRSLELQTYQPVQNELVDPNRQIYRLQVSCPPTDRKNIWAWIFSRNYVNNAEIEE